MLKFDFEEPIETGRDSNGNPTQKLTRFVYRDNAPFAAYYAAFTPNNVEKRLDGIIGLGKWGGAKSDAQERVAFVFQIWPGFDDLQAGLLDAQDSPWHGVTELGAILDREDALDHEWIDDAFLVIKSMVLEDKAIVDYFDTNPTYN